MILTQNYYERSKLGSVAIEIYTSTCNYLSPLNSFVVQEMTDDRELKTVSTKAKNYYYTGTIGDQESYWLAVNMCNG